MKHKTCIILLLLIIFSLISPMFVPSASSVFGDGENSQTNVVDGSIQEKAEAEGEFAGKVTADFKDIDGLNLAIEKLFGYIRWGIAFLTTLGTISSFLILSMAFVRLANAPEASFQRRHCYTDILKGGVSVICFGGLTLLMTIFYKTFSVFISKTVMLSSNWKTAFAYALVEFKYLICGVCGVLSLTMFILFIKEIFELANSGGNPQKRSQSIQQLLIVGLATIGLGGVGVFVAIFNGLLA